MPYNYVTESFHITNFVPITFFKRSAILGGELGATYDDHLRLIGKRVVNFLLVLMNFFSLGVTAEALRAIIGSKSTNSLQQLTRNFK